MKRIGIFGGTFNPVHNGHVWLAQEFSRRLLLDEVILIPTKQPTHKAATQLASPEDRLEMCRLAVEPLGFWVSDIEVKRSSDSYTVLTLRQLRREFPADQFYLLMGEDMYLTLDRWREPQAIFEMAVLCVSPRSSDPDTLARLKEYGHKLEKLGARSILLEIPYLAVSSTAVRKALQNGTDLQKLVPKAVADYMAARHLYEAKKDEFDGG